MIVESLNFELFLRQELKATIFANWLVMDYPQECLCGRTFSQVNAMSNHRRTCKKSKSRLSSMLTDAQENWRRKKARLNNHGKNLLTERPMGESVQAYATSTSVNDIVSFSDRY